MAISIFFNFQVSARTLVIGSKKFTEANILAHFIKQEISKIAPKQDVKVLENLGGTGIVQTALMTGSIDLYVDYTGTLEASYKTDTKNLEGELEKRGLLIGARLGFNNTYALVTKQSNPLVKISQLKNKQARIGMSHEFYERLDGYRPLAKRYQLALQTTTLEHALIYPSLSSDSLDYAIAYATDAKIKKHNLKTLTDDYAFFPTYQAILVVSKKMTKDFPSLYPKLVNMMEGRLNEDKMIETNYLVDIDRQNYAQAASTLSGKKLSFQESDHLSIMPYFIQHLLYLIVTACFCIMIGIPLGVLATRSTFWERTLLSLVSILQTIPSLALLVFLIPIFGLGQTTAVIALVLYGLLPIVKNTHTGIKNISHELIEYAELIGMKPLKRILTIELPLAKYAILAGVKLTCIYTVGITVIAAFIGAGGLGTLIVSGLSLNDHELILKGAIPSALLALMIEIIFQKVLPLFEKGRSS
jgi:osmoprotectant transport system permease protein